MAKKAEIDIGLLITLLFSVLFHCNGAFVENNLPVFRTASARTQPISSLNFQIKKDGGNLTDSIRQGIEIRFTLAASGLPPMDGNNELRGAIGYGRTQTLQDQHNPVWPDVFTVVYYSDQLQRIDIEIRDDDPVSPDDSIGMSYVFVQLIEQECNQYTFPIKNGQDQRGILIVNRPRGPTTPTTTRRTTTPTTTTTSTTERTTSTSTTTRRTTTTERTTTYRWSSASANGAFLWKYILCLGICLSVSAS